MADGWGWSEAVQIAVGTAAAGAFGWLARVATRLSHVEHVADATAHDLASLKSDINSKLDDLRMDIRQLTSLLVSAGRLRED